MLHSCYVNFDSIYTYVAQNQHEAHLSLSCRILLGPRPEHKQLAPLVNFDMEPENNHHLPKHPFSRRLNRAYNVPKKLVNRFWLLHLEAVVV